MLTHDLKGDFIDETGKPRYISRVGTVDEDELLARPEYKAWAKANGIPEGVLPHGGSFADAAHSHSS